MLAVAVVRGGTALFTPSLFLACLRGLSPMPFGRRFCLSTHADGRERHISRVAWKKIKAPIISTFAFRSGCNYPYRAYAV